MSGEIRFRNDPGALVMVVAFGVAAAVNLAQFEYIDKSNRHNYQAFKVYETNDVTEIAIAKNDFARIQVAPYYYLRTLYPNSTFVLPLDSGGMRARLYGVGGADQLIDRDYDPKALAAKVDLKDRMVDLTRLMPARSTAQRLINKVFGVAVSENPSGTFVLLSDPDGRSIYTDSNLLDEKTRDALDLP